MVLIKRAVKRIARSAGFEITRGAPKPVLSALPVIHGSYTPYELLYVIGKPENYFIRDDYTARTEYSYFNDTANTDQWQEEVYRFAREVADRHGLRRVCDVGCGAAFKLLRDFADCETIGLDVEETVAALRAKYPNRRWVVSDFVTKPPIEPELVICSDVIEHVLEPNALIDYLKVLGAKFLVISTPDRNLFRRGTCFGPPANTAHIREWSMPEFHAYIGSHFEIVEHFISNAAQATQCVLARPKSAIAGR